MLTIDEELDVRGFNDPIPTMRAMKRLGQLAVNQRLKVITNYGGGAILDFEALCKSRNHELMETREENGDIIFIIKKVLPAIDEELDVRGLNCPMPIIRTRHSLKHLSVGQHLKIIATDPGTVRDFEALCGHTGNKLVTSESENGEYIFIIKKASEDKQSVNS